MAGSKQAKINRLHRLMEQQPRLAVENLNALKTENLNLDELQRYMEQQFQKERQLTAAMNEDAALATNPFTNLTARQLELLAVHPNAILALGVKLEQARRDFFCYCNLRAPDFYRPERTFLVQLCSELQGFSESPEERVMIIALPPRHGKSRTAGLFVQWLYGKDPTNKIMTGSYNVTLSTTFSKTVRNGIQEEKAEPDKIVYTDIFPSVQIQRGDAAMNLWSLEGQYASYLATSPDGTATGFGASWMFIDDLIKKAEEAFNEDALEAHWKWFTDTMLSRLEENGKIIIIMTRWAGGDLAGRTKQYFTEQNIPIREVVMKAVQDDGTMLCPEILSYASYQMKSKAMSAEIASANYQQIPIDLKGKLYSTLKTYPALPVDEHGKKITTGVFNYTDTADEGSDYLCSIDYEEYNGEAYIINLIYTQDGMEFTEPAVARMLDEDNVGTAEIESNNGGRGFARNVQTQLKEKLRNRRCTVKWFHQSANKKSRILTNASWVMEHIYFPANWRDRWPEFFSALQRYQKAGKNTHDDAPDALTGIAEHFTKPQRHMKLGKRRFGL